MKQGYFAALVHALVRETRDGRLVTGRRAPPLFRKRWYYVTPEDRKAFEARVVRANLLAMLTMVLVVRLVSDPVSLWTLAYLALLVLVINPALQAWITSGLAVAEIDKSSFEPMSRTVRDLRSARAAGAPTTGAMIAIGVVLTLLQLMVAVTGVWWAWLGAAMFGAVTVYFVRLLILLLDDDTASRAEPPMGIVK